MEKQILFHITAMFIVAIVAILGVTAMFMHGKAAEAPGRIGGELGDFCRYDSQCLSGQCNGAIMLPNGNTVPGIQVCT